MHQLPQHRRSGRVARACARQCSHATHRRSTRAPHRFGLSQLIAFQTGLIVIVCAILSPLDAFAGWLLTVHMIQHLLLMMAAPPLILYGAPYLPLLSGLPRDFLKNGVAPFLASGGLRKVGSFVAHPIFC